MSFAMLFSFLSLSWKDLLIANNLHFMIRWTSLITLVELWQENTNDKIQAKIVAKLFRNAWKHYSEIWVINYRKVRNVSAKRKRQFHWFVLFECANEFTCSVTFIRSKIRLHTIATSRLAQKLCFYGFDILAPAGTSDAFTWDHSNVSFNSRFAGKKYSETKLRRKKCPGTKLFFFFFGKFQHEFRTQNHHFRTSYYYAEWKCKRKRYV